MLAIMTIAQICASLVLQGYGALAPFIISFFHLTKTELGVSYGAIMLGGAVSAFAGGVGVDRFGERAMTIFSGVAIFAALCLGVFVPTYAALVGSMFLLGAVYSAIAPAGGRAILGWFGKHRGLAMGIRQTGIAAGAAIGGLLLPFIALHAGYRAALFAGAVSALVGTAGVTLFYRDPEDDVVPFRGLGHLREGFEAIFADPRTVPFMITSMILTAAQMCGNGFLALTVISFAHVHVGVAAVVFTIMQLSAAAGRVAWGWLSDALFGGDRTLPLAVVCFVSGCGLFGIGLATGSLPLLVVCSAIIGFTGNGWTGLYTVALAEIGGARFAGMALGMGSSLTFSAAVVGPVAFGAIADAFGLHVSWTVLAGLVVLGVVPAFVAYQRFAKRRVLLEGGGAASG